MAKEEESPSGSPPKKRAHDTSRDSDVVESLAAVLSESHMRHIRGLEFVRDMRKRVKSRSDSGSESPDDNTTSPRSPTTP